MTSKKPTLVAYSIREREKGKSDIWTRIGAAWPFESEKGNKGFTIQLDALPLGGRLVLAEPKAEPEAAMQADGEGAQ